MDARALQRINRFLPGTQPVFRLDDPVRLFRRGCHHQRIKEAKNTWLWIKEGWHVAVTYVLGFWVLYLTLGWHPDLLLGRAAEMTCFVRLIRRITLHGSFRFPISHTGRVREKPE